MSEGKLVITFAKGEDARFMGHLDVLRTMIRTIRRANLPLKYSQGNNPHAAISFALPLGVGVTSDCEKVYISVDEFVEPLEFVQRFNKVATSGIRLIDGTYEEQDVDFNRAKWKIEIVGENLSELEKVPKLKEMLVEKKSKRNLNEVDLMPYIYGYKVDELLANRAIIDVTIAGGTKYNIKPFLLINGIEKYTNVKVQNCLPRKYGTEMVEE